MNRFNTDSKNTIKYKKTDKKTDKKTKLTTVCFKNYNVDRKKYLAYMNKTMRKKCAVNLKAIKCKSCSNFKKMNDYINARTKNHSSYRARESTIKIFNKSLQQCNRCLGNNIPCTEKQYLKYSNSTLGPCKKRYNL